MKLLGSTKKDGDQDKDGDDVPKLEYVEVFSVHCNLVNNNYQQASKVLLTFVPNKQFGQLITIALRSWTILNTMNTEFSSIEVWFYWSKNSRSYRILNWKEKADKTTSVKKTKSNRNIYKPPET